MSLLINCTVQFFYGTEYDATATSRQFRDCGRGVVKFCGEENSCFKSLLRVIPRTPTLKSFEICAMLSIYISEPTRRALW